MIEFDMIKNCTASGNFLSHIKRGGMAYQPLGKISCLQYRTLQLAQNVFKSGQQPMFFVEHPVKPKG